MAEEVSKGQLLHFWAFMCSDAPHVNRSEPCPWLVFHRPDQKLLQQCTFGRKAPVTRGNTRRTKKMVGVFRRGQVEQGVSSLPSPPLSTVFRECCTGADPF